MSTLEMQEKILADPRYLEGKPLRGIHIKAIIGDVHWTTIRDVRYALKKRGLLKQLNDNDWIRVNQQAIKPSMLVMRTKSNEEIGLETSTMGR